MLIYPPGKLFQRGEERCQGNIEDSAATTIRACNDLGYAAAVLRDSGYGIFLRDYQSSARTMDNLMTDFSEFAPDAVFMSVTNATIFSDLDTASNLKKNRPGTLIILKGAVFHDAPQELFANLDLSCADYLIGGESEFVILPLLDSHFSGAEPDAVPGLFYRKGGSWRKTYFGHFEENLDSLPFPARDLMENGLYTRPDTGEAQATIHVSRGCPSSCSYCLTPVISGRKLRARSPRNVFAEISECYYKYGIKNFFFRSDTFTFNKKWVLELCSLITDSELKGRISWAANSKSRPLDMETLASMKKAGCWLIAIGFESGSEETLSRIKKGATVGDNLNAAVMVKKTGMELFGFFMAGFPWESSEHLEQTKKHIFETDPDYIEIHIPVPYPGTALYSDAINSGLTPGPAFGKDYFSEITSGTGHLSRDELLSFRKKTLLLFHLRPAYIARKFIRNIGRPVRIKNYIRYGIKLLKSQFKHT